MSMVNSFIYLFIYLFNLILFFSLEIAALKNDTLFFFSLTIQNKINKKKIISKTDFYFSNMKGSVY